MQARILADIMLQQELKSLAAKTYAVIGALWVAFGPKLSGSATVDLNDVNSLCHEGWAYAAGSCFQALAQTPAP